jgi:glycosyltransferase involved in cell wall biosynthesis
LQRWKYKAKWKMVAIIVYFRCAYFLARRINKYYVGQSFKKTCINTTAAMDIQSRAIRVLWFSNSPGLGQNYFKIKVFGEGWITALQTEIEKVDSIKLGYVFYTDDPLDSFEFNKTTYFPVQKIANTKNKRLLYRVIGKIEREENVSTFLRIIDEFKPDLIHIQGTESPFGLIQKHITNIPIVISIQGNLTAYTSRYFAGMKMPGLIAQMSAGYPYPSMDYTLWLARVEVEREILKRTKYVLGRTHWDRRICLVLAQDSKYYHVEELMRSAFYSARWVPVNNPSPVFFTTSSGSFYKGLETLIEAARILTENKFSFSWKVAGVSETDSLVKLIKKQTGIGSFKDIHVELLGKLSEDHLISHMKAADVYVQVSHIENSPNSLCEAMLLGMPLVASFAGGTSSLVEDNVSGVLVQDGDPYVVAGALVESVKNRDMAIQMGERAREISHQRHNAQEILSTLLRTYDEIIADFGKDKASPIK